MGYIYIFGSYCFTYEHFVDLVRMNRLCRSKILEWLQPLIDDDILTKWLSSLGDIKADELVKLVDECQVASKSTENIVKRICLEIELA